MGTAIEKHAGGRPLKFDSVEDLDAKIQAYYDSRKRKRTVITKNGSSYEEEYELPKTLAGLAVALDCDRKTLLNYSKRDKFFPSLARAKAICQNYAVDQLFLGNDRGAKFVLINDHVEEKWADKTEVNQTLNVNVSDSLLSARARAQLMRSQQVQQLAPGVSAQEVIDGEIVDNSGAITDNDAD